MLRHRIYPGDISRRRTAYPGEHEAIAECSLFEQVSHARPESGRQCRCCSCRAAKQDRIEIRLAQRDDQAEPIVIPRTVDQQEGGEAALGPDEARCQTLPDAMLVKLTVRAFQAREMVEATEANSFPAAAGKLGVSAAYFALLIRLSYLAPDIVAAILDGRQPMTLKRQRVARISSLPMSWQDQRALLEFA